MEYYFRITYNNIGIYEALKNKIWDNNSVFSKEDWINFKNSSDVNWLKVPSVYGNDNYSYFTELGFNIFMEKTYPLIIKYLDKENICIDKYLFDIEEFDLIYCDEHQIVINKSSIKE